MEDRFPAAGEAGRLADPAGQQDFHHLAFFYRGTPQYQPGLGGFIRAALARRSAVNVAVPMARAGPLRAALGTAARQVHFADMADLGRNPGRILPAYHSFADRHRGRPVTCVGEPVWPARSPPELAESARHEALVNLAFAGQPVTVLCPYDQAGLPLSALAHAEHTHPELLSAEGARPSAAYLGPGRLPPGCDEPLPAPPPGTPALRYHADLRLVRAQVSGLAARAGLSPDRAADLVLAVSELAANTLSHTAEGGVLSCWQAPGELLCEITDQGWIADPLAGRQRPPEDGRGHGLWLVHQVCDLVELRTRPSGSVIRLHMRLEDH